MPPGAGRIRERAMSSMVTTRGRMAIKYFTTIKRAVAGCFFNGSLGHILDII